MTQQVTITIDDEALMFLDEQSRGNRSEYINNLLIQQRYSTLQAELAAAHQQDAQNHEYLAEIALWDAVAGDGILEDETNA